ncbi:MAG: exodeoxyribonuclease [Gammaproteobacteria bacterium]|jgi:exodeoxyribonuclease-1|nr:exodeoxyribonuclease [Gammaproteobacteria bacterium]
MDTFLFYDIETTGLNKAFDQVLHFAAIRTDRMLKELERYEIRIKLNLDVIPSPAAIMTHQINLKEMTAGITEFDGIKQIHLWLNQPNTISLGYNTLRFDDEFLRFSFYRNLLSPYTHQYANQCGRMDLYPITVMYFLFKNPILQWPLMAGKPSFKLAELSRANHLAEGRAHHAMVDVEATLALAQLFFKEPEMWNYLAGFFNKELDQNRLQDVLNSPALMIDGILGAEHHYQCPVLFLGMHKYYKNQMIWLRLDTEELAQLTMGTISQARTIHKKIGEPPFILPLKERFLGNLSPDRRILADYNKRWLEQNSDILAQLIAYHTEYQYPLYPATDVSAKLYINGFWNDAERNFCCAFHAADPQEKAKLIERIQNPTLQMLALRILGRHYPQTLSPPQAALFSEYMKKMNPAIEEEILIDYQGKKRLTPRIALKEIEELRQDPHLTAAQLKLLTPLESFYQRLLS